MAQTIEASLKSIGRVIESFGTLNEHLQHYRSLADKHERALQNERDISRDLNLRLDAAQKENAGLQNLLRSEKQRSAEAASRAMALENCVKGLEDDNAVLRSQAIRLVQGIETLMAAENGLHLA